MIVIPILGAAGIWDLKTKQIPNWLLGIGFILALGAAGVDSLNAVWSCLGGTLVGIVVMLPLYNWKLMGGGDVKLAGLIGAMNGFPDGLIAIVMGLTLGAVLIPLLQAVGAVKRGDKVPFGPILACGGIMGYFWAGPLVDVYTRII